MATVFWRKLGGVFKVRTHGLSWGKFHHKLKRRGNIWGLTYLSETQFYWFINSIVNFTLKDTETGENICLTFLAEIKVWAISRASSLKSWFFADLQNNIYNDPDLILETIKAKRIILLRTRKHLSFMTKVFVASKGQLVTFALAANHFNKLLLKSYLGQ